MREIQSVLKSNEEQELDQLSSFLNGNNIENPSEVEKVKGLIIRDPLKKEFVEKAAGQAEDIFNAGGDIEDIEKAMVLGLYDESKGTAQTEKLGQVSIKEALQSIDEDAIVDGMNLCRQAQVDFLKVCNAMTQSESRSLVDLLNGEKEDLGLLAHALIKKFNGEGIDKDALKEQLSIMICIDEDKRNLYLVLVAKSAIAIIEYRDFLKKTFKGKYSYEPVTDTDKDFQKVFGYSRASRGKASSSNAKVSASGGAVSSFSNGNGGAKTAKSASSQDSGVFANSNQQEALPQDYSASQYEANFYEANLRDNEQPAEIEGSDNSSQKENAKIASLENKIEELMNKIESSKLEKKENQELDFENQTDFTEDDYELTKLKKELKKAQEELESEKEALAQRKAKRPERRGFASTYTDGITNIRNFGNGSQGNSGHNNSNRPLNDVINNAFNGGAIPSSSASFSESKGKYQNNREGITLDSSSFSNESEISEGIITIEGEKARVFEANHDLKEAFELAAGEPALIEVEDGQFMRIICNELSGECDLEHVDVDKKGGEAIASGGEVDQGRVVSGDSFVGPQKPSLKWGEAKAIVEQATQESE